MGVNDDNNNNSNNCKGSAVCDRGDNSTATKATFPQTPLTIPLAQVKTYELHNTLLRI